MIVFYLLLILNLKFIDYNNKSFNTNLDVYLKYREFNKTNYEIRPNILSLHFQVILPDFSYKGYVEFTTSQSNYIKIKNNNIPSTFNKSFTFSMDLFTDKNILNIQTNSKSLKKQSFNVTLKLLNRICKIGINFKMKENFINDEIFSLENINKYNLEYYNFQRKWIPIELKNGENKNVLIGTHVSHFGFEPTINLSYHKEEEISKSWNNKTIKKIKLCAPRFQNNLLTLNINKILLFFGTEIKL